MTAGQKKEPFYPPPLDQKETVALVSPSRQAPSEMIEACASRLRTLGYDVFVHPQNFLSDGILAGTEKERAKAFMEVITNPSFQAVLCVRGGAGAGLLLNRLDYEVIRQNPKPVIGFSDATVLLNAITNRTGLVTFHGPMARHFGNPLPSFQTERDFVTMIGASSLIGQQLVFSQIETEREGQVEGRLVGGNLSLLQTLIGTSYDWQSEGTVLFIEEVEEPLYKIERALAHLHMAGKFEGVRGVLIGEMVGILDDRPDLNPAEHTVYGRTLKEIILKYMPHHAPLVFGVPCGHGSYITTFPIGARVCMGVEKDSCRVKVLA